MTVVVSYQTTSFVLGIMIAGMILFLVRKDLLHTRYAVLWFFFAGAAIFFGAMPQVIDGIAGYLGVHYPPILFVVSGMAILLIKILTMDLDRSSQEKKIRLLNEKLAIMASRLEERGQTVETEETDAPIAHESIEK